MKIYQRLKSIDQPLEQQLWDNNPESLMQAGLCSSSNRREKLV